MTFRSVSLLSHKRASVAAAVLGSLVFGAAQSAQAAEVNVYSSRQEVLIRPLIKQFEKQTGIKVNIVYMKKGMFSRLKAEGKNSPADVVLLTDAARLIQLQRGGLLQPVTSKTLTNAIPANLRHPKGLWFGLTMRARPIMYNPKKVSPSELSTYAALANKKWKNRICIRSSTNVYNRSLIASLIANNGAKKTEEWAKKFVGNFARRPKGGDRDQIKAVAAGECDIAVANTYYLAGMSTSKSKAQRDAAAKVKIFWPNQKGRGAHVNISGGAVTAAAKNKAAAIKLLEFLVSEDAQRLYAEKVNEYPVRIGTGLSGPVAAFGRFKADELPLSKLEKYGEQATKIADRAGWR